MMQDATLPEPRVLGVDFGERRIGLSLSDPTGTLASPLDTVTRRRGRRMPLQAIIDRLEGYRVDALVVGLPLDLEGEENEWCRDIRRAGDELGRRLQVPVHYVDERFSSVRAEQALRAQGLRPSLRANRPRIDAAAATVILQEFLDNRTGS